MEQEPSAAQALALATDDAGNPLGQGTFMRILIDIERVSNDGVVYALSDANIYEVRLGTWSGL